MDSWQSLDRRDSPRELAGDLLDDDADRGLGLYSSRSIQIRRSWKLSWRTFPIILINK